MIGYVMLIPSDVQSLTVEGEDGLVEGRQKLQAIGFETKRALKKTVYDNYLKFIDAAKEIYSMHYYSISLHTLQTLLSVDTASVF